MTTAHIVLTGGGTAGHVTPNLALIEALSHENGYGNWKIDYIGSKNSVEQRLIEAISLPFHPISSGKLRRYFSWQTFVDPFKILLGIVQSYRLLGRLKTDVVFSKGGFVSFPVVFAAWLRKIPIVAHESDMSPGLANRLSLPFVNTICLNFEASRAYYKKNKNSDVIVTGTPIRSMLFKGDRQRALKICGFKDNKPCLLLMGGSLGASALNNILRKSLEKLNQDYQVIHLCGKGNLDKHLTRNQEYAQIEFANEELADLFALAKIVISRAGANSLCEILALQKPHVLIPLPLAASRGDQIENAHYFERLGISTVIDQEKLTEDTFLSAIKELSSKEKEREVIEKMQTLGLDSAASKIIAILERTTAQHKKNKKKIRVGLDPTV